MAALHEDQRRLLRKQALAASPSVAREDELLAGETFSDRRRIVQRGLRHAQDFSWQQAAIETHATLYTRAWARARSPCRASTTRTTAPA
jgi:hypothetical protein